MNQKHCRRLRVDKLELAVTCRCMSTQFLFFCLVLLFFHSARSQTDTTKVFHSASVAMGLCTVTSTWTRESITSSLHPPPPPTHFITSSLCCACCLKHWLLLAELDGLISPSFRPSVLHAPRFHSLLLLCRLRATPIHKRCCY